MSLAIDNFDESVLGAETSDPLRFAFPKKHSAHAAGMAAPIMPDKKGEILQRVFQSETQSGRHRCLYIHIPFCRVRCTFCNFFQNAASRKLVDDYFDALLIELQLKAQQPWTQAGQFHAVYVGGGTPTDLRPEQVQMLSEKVRALFPLSPDCEITLEGRINRFGDEMFERALEGGFNRFSFGVQSFNTQVRRKAKRLDDREVVLERLQHLSATEQAPIIIDLLYGLPYQDMDVFKQDLEDCLLSGVHGVDLYQLMVTGSAPMINLVEKGRLPSPASTPDKARMYQLGVDFMAKHHMRQLSVNHWARDNRERSLYNSLAKTSAEVLPVGCGAGGNIGGYSMMHHRTLETYMQAMKSGDSTVAMMMKQHPYEPVFASIKAGFDSGVLRKTNLGHFEGEPVFDYLKPLFDNWVSKGLVKLEENYLVTTLAGSFWSVSLSQSCIKVLQQVLNAKKPARPDLLTGTL